MQDQLRVAVRVRPFIHHYEKGAKCIIKMVKRTEQTIITHPKSGKERCFTFDKSYDSFLPSNHPDHASQLTVWTDLGEDVLNNAWEGYNVSLFAYGQTGAGKSHSMVGYPGAEGIVPKACREIFKRIGLNQDPHITHKVEASMLEIYNERTRDLFDPSGSKKNLKVRDNPKSGPYVQNLTKTAVSDYPALQRAMDAGTAARTVAATAMNATSSRAHTIFQIVLTTTSGKGVNGRKATDKVSAISLIDLAGSERAARSGASGDRLKEGCAINRSLSALGNVISALAERATNPRKRNLLVPYRESVLTHLLKNSLGGNAKTIMIAAISPSDLNYDETMSTLRYADRAKKIKNKAVVNEDPNEKLITGLQKEIELLKKRLKEEALTAAAKTADALSATNECATSEREGALAVADHGQKGIRSGGGKEDIASAVQLERERWEKEKAAELHALQEQVEENERLLHESQKSWDEKLKEAKRAADERSRVMMRMGVAEGRSSDAKRRTSAHMVNLNEDPALSESLCYFFECGTTCIGRADASNPQDIVLGGLNILKEHAVVSSTLVESPASSADDPSFAAPRAFRLAIRKAVDAAKVYINGEPLDSSESLSLQHHDRVLLGNSHVFRIHLPWACAPADGGSRPPDWHFAMKEKNNAVIVALSSDEHVREAEAQSQLANMEKKVKELEGALSTAQEHAGHKMDAKVAELRNLLEQQIAENNNFRAQQEKERWERSLLDELLLKTIPQLNEANAISEELLKGKTFSITLKASTAQAKRAAAGTLTATRAARGAAAEEEPTTEGGTAFSSDTDVWIKVMDDAHGARKTEGLDAIHSAPFVMWSLGKFTNRLYLMRELYQRFLEMNRDCTALERACGSEHDPFYDPPEDQLSGTAIGYLNSLYYFLDIEDSVPIIDYKGTTVGELQIKIEPVRGIGPKAFDPLEDEKVYQQEDVTMSHVIGKTIGLSVTLVSAHGLLRARNKAIRIQYRLFCENMFSTAPLPSPSINPTLGCQHVTYHTITEEFIDYICSESLDFDVFCSSFEEEAGNKEDLETPASHGEVSTKSQPGACDMANEAQTKLLRVQDELTKSKNENELLLKRLQGYEARIDRLLKQCQAMEDSDIAQRRELETLKDKLSRRQQRSTPAPLSTGAAATVANDTTNQRGLQVCDRCIIF